MSGSLLGLSSGINENESQAVAFVSEYFFHANGMIYLREFIEHNCNRFIDMLRTK